MVTCPIPNSLEAISRSRCKTGLGSCITVASAVTWALSASYPVVMDQAWISCTPVTPSSSSKRWHSWCRSKWDGVPSIRTCTTFQSNRKELARTSTPMTMPNIGSAISQPNDRTSTPAATTATEPRRSAIT